MDRQVPVYLWEHTAAIILGKPVSRAESVPAVLLRLWCEGALITGTAETKVSIFLLGGRERRVYEVFLNENSPAGVLLA